VNTVALAQQPIPDALWAEVATVTPTTEEPEAGRFS
jgi:hypothetical protein